MKENIIQNSYEKIKAFEIEAEQTSVKDLLRNGKFNVKINNERYSVYPDYTQLMPQNSTHDKMEVFKGKNISMCKK